MLAVQVRSFGPPHTHAVEELPGLEPGAGQVCIDVQAAAVNYPDTLVVSGRYQSRNAAMPLTPGKEAAGIVRCVGAGVARFKAGDRVLAHVESGAFATELIAPEAQCMPLPDGMAFVDAMLCGLAAQTAWFALVERGRCTAGDIVLVNGATGAVGQAAMQIAVSLGATVLAGVNSHERGEHLLGHGPWHTIDLGQPDLREALRNQVHQATGGRGVDVVIDPLGADVFDASVRALTWDGRIVTLGFAAGRIPEVKANYLLVKNITATGLQWSDYRDRQPAKVARAHECLVELWRRGVLRSRVMPPLPLSRFADALQLIESRSADGRVVLTMT